VLSEPPKEGINWLAYVVPPVAIFAGAFILYRSLMAWRESAVPVSSEDAPAPPIPETEEDEYLARIEEELRKRD
jgi:cytochrome c-type biogenesis protein CcmH/NrfF